MITEDEMMQPLNIGYSPFNSKYSTKKISILTDNKMALEIIKLSRNNARREKQFDRFKGISPIAMITVIEYYCKIVKIKYSDLIKKNRKTKYVKYRQIIGSWLDENSCVHGNKYFLESQGKIAKLLGFGDHSIIPHCTKKVNQFCETEQLYKKEVEEINEKLNNYINEIKLTNEKNDSNNNL